MSENKNINKENDSSKKEDLKNNVKYREYLIKKAAIIKIICFLAAMVVGAVISLIIPLRPTVSEKEKRNLASFPEFEFGSFASGEYFSKVDTWFADTFPGRDGLILCSEMISSLYGMRSNSFHGTLMVGDEIPDSELNEGEFDYLKELMDGAGVSADTSGDISKNNEKDKNSGNSNSTQDYNFQFDKVVDVSEIGDKIDKTDNTSEAKVGESFDSIFVVGDSAYNYFVFLQSASDNYVQLVNNLADKLDGKAKVYDLIIPTSMDITLDDATRNSISSDNQNAAIKYIFSRMNSKVGKTYIYELMRAHRNEYIYFRTDHHWTALGAYYAYAAFMAQTGQKAVSLDSMEKYEIEGFLGSFYSQTQESSLTQNPDTVNAYVPNDTNSMKYLDRQGQWNDYRIVTDTTPWNASNKYSAFIGGDNPLTIIENPNITDGSSILVIKESYGNAFTPYLVSNYQNVYVLDYRYYKGKVSDFVEENNVGTVLFVNNLTAICTDIRVEEMMEICQ